MTDEQYKDYIKQKAEETIQEFVDIGVDRELAKKCAHLKWVSLKINFDNNFGDNPDFEKVWDIKIGAFDDVIKAIEETQNEKTD